MRHMLVSKPTAAQAKGYLSSSTPEPTRVRANRIDTSSCYLWNVWHMI